MNHDSPLDRQAYAVQSSTDQPQIMLPRNTSEIFLRDPRCIGFIAARHKLVAKTLEGLSVLEVGCQEGFGTLFVAPYVADITCIDFYPPFIDEFQANLLRYIPNGEVVLHDITKNPLPQNFDGCFALDVLEHINPRDEHCFWDNVVKSLSDDGIFIVGMPSLESQPYASEGSKIGHVNCKSGADLKIAGEKYFKHVNLLCMNDEMIHYGFPKMAHYILVICTTPKR